MLRFWIAACSIFVVAALTCEINCWHVLFESCRHFIIMVEYFGNNSQLRFFVLVGDSSAAGVNVPSQNASMTGFGLPSHSMSQSHDSSSNHPSAPAAQNQSIQRKGSVSGG